ncbi:hypothetical protein B0A52_08061 [Exophiala mesophila]|uniref:Uncharacterized protein n=1 Tax=Exophiala mesophila TaxID=212818 RepID=A0A438MZX6_EXOME|nr:hypothetical protein B0A52_08061 [Exophiala mesophila]
MATGNSPSPPFPKPATEQKFHSLSTEQINSPQKPDPVAMPHMDFEVQKPNGDEN